MPTSVRCKDMAEAKAATNPAVQAAAAQWLARMQAGDCTAQERAACKRWREADAAHAVAYAQLERIHDGVAGLRPDPSQIHALQAIRERGDRRASRRRGFRRWGTGLGVAATVLIAVGLGWQFWNPEEPAQRYTTAVGEQRVVALADGSELLLDTDSTVEVRYSRKRRDLSLERGQAQFTVAHAADRPFLVRAGMGEVRALGTRFQVRRLADAVEIALLDGKVSVTAHAPDGKSRSTTLSVGEGLHLDGAGAWASQPIDPEVLEGWTRGELVFRQRPLPELIEEMNRYTRVKLRLGDPALADLTLSGVFYDANQASLLNALDKVWNVRAERASAEEIVLYRH